MTLVAGFPCPDGFVLAADTEIGHHTVKYQQNKILEFHRKNAQPAYWLVIGGGGDGRYLDGIMQQIGSAVDGLTNPTVTAVASEIARLIREAHDDTLFKYWKPNDPDRPEVGFVIGLRDCQNQIGVWQTEDVAVNRVSGRAAYIGTGAAVAGYVGQSLFHYGAPVAEVHHVAGQILREVKAKAAFVGGNTDVCSVVRVGAAHRPFFDISVKENRYLWRLDDVLNSAVRCALSGRDAQVTQRITIIAKTLKQISQDSKTPFSSQDSEWHTLEINADDTHPFSDL